MNSDREYADKFREIFAEAVRCRLRSVYPVGSMLSGGLDSSSVTCMAQKISCDEKKPSLHTFSSVFKAVPESDESPFIDAVIAQGKVLPHYIHGDRVSPLVDIKKALWHQDEPIFACNLYLNWKIYEQAQKLGIRVMLDGFDGDNTVSHGVGYLKELAIANRWWKLIVEVKGLTKNFNYPFWKNFWIYLEHYGIKPIVDRYRILRFIWYRSQNLLQKLQAKSDTKPKSWASILNNQFIDKIKIRERRKKLLRERQSTHVNQRYEHYKDIKNGLLPTTLEVLNKTAAAHTIEIRYPLWDKRLVEFCLSLPTEQKMQQGWTRMIMRRGMDGILPKKIQWRGGKGNLGYSFEYGLRTFEKENLRVFFENSELVEKYINIKYLDEVYQDFISEFQESSDSMAIWKSINLALWLKSNNICV